MDQFGTDKTQEKEGDGHLAARKTSPVRVGPRSASSIRVCDAQVEGQLIGVRQLLQSTSLKQNGKPDIRAQSVRTIMGIKRERHSCNDIEMKEWIWHGSCVQCRSVDSCEDKHLLFENVFTQQG